MVSRSRALLEEFPPAPALVELEVEDGRVVWVRVAQDWKEHVMPYGLLNQVRLAVPPIGSPPLAWTDKIDLTKIPISELREFNASLREARAEAQLETADEEFRTTHFVARWRGGVLIALEGDPKWMAETTRQALCEELSRAVAAPPYAQPVTKARTRFIKLMEKYS